MRTLLTKATVFVLSGPMLACAHAPARMPSEPAHTQPLAEVSAEPTDEPAVETDAVEPRTSADGFAAFACSPATSREEGEREQRRRGDELGLDPAFDHVRVNRVAPDESAEPFAVRGEACANASVKAACLEKVAKLEGHARKKRGAFAITTRGDEVEVYRGAELVALVAPIDSAEKAWLALMTRESVAAYLCGDVDWNGHRALADGHELLWVWTRSSCQPFEQVRTVTLVDREGGVKRVRRTVERTAQRCVVDESGWRRGASVGGGEAE